LTLREDLKALNELPDAGINKEEMAQLPAVGLKVDGR
jgi:hypothetical protein